MTAPPGGLSRRTLLRGAAVALAIPALRTQAQGFGGRDPFTLGVASGMPGADGVVLWTRLAPDPLQGGGVGEAPIVVRWEVAEDEAFQRIAAAGEVQAVAAEAHSARAEVRGLAAGRPYWYRFNAGGARSPVGRTRTAPAADSTAPVRFAFASCQHYEQGYFGAYRDLAAQPLDLVVHLGDYIYESSWGQRHVRRHDTAVPTLLPEFRDRYALYKMDRDLQSAHAAVPWLVTWDDHEVANDYTNDVSPRSDDPAQFLRIRAAAYQAWYEHMPVPARMRPRGADVAIHGRHGFGSMLDLFLLDGRQYRSHHVCLPGRSATTTVDCAARLDPARSYLGAAQEAWLAGGLASAKSRWTVIAQPTLMAEVDRGTGDAPAYWMDGWDGYPASRQRLLDALVAHKVRNPLVIGGDVHAFWAADVRARAGGAVVASEFTGGAITSQGPSEATVKRLLARNPHLRYGRADRRGYAVVSLKAGRAEVEFRAVDDEKLPDSPARTLRRFAVADGAPGVQLDGG